jgi:DNA-binding MarR family transcriptional regulator
MVIERDRRRRIAAAKQNLRELRLELAVLNHRVGGRVELRDGDFDCLDVITRHGPLSPSALARRIGVPMATMTGILDRLETGAWIIRERHDSDRRAVLIRSAPDKQGEIFAQFGGMNSSLDAILEDYTDEQLDLIIDFLGRCSAAGEAAALELAADAG